MPTVDSLIVARILQAIGASAGIVVGRAIIRDLFDRNRAAAMIGLVATVMVVVPTLRPADRRPARHRFRLGIDLHLHRRDHRSLVVCWAAITLPETRGLNAAAGRQRKASCAISGSLTRSRDIPGYVLAASFGSSTFFAFLGGGPHVIVTLMEPHLGRVRRVVRDLLDRLHGRQFRRLAAVDAARHRHADLVGHRFEVVGVALATVLALVRARIAGRRSCSCRS